MKPLHLILLPLPAVIVIASLSELAPELTRSFAILLQVPQAALPNIEASSRTLVLIYSALSPFAIYWMFERVFSMKRVSYSAYLTSAKSLGFRPLSEIVFDSLNDEFKDVVASARKRKIARVSTEEIIIDDGGSASDCLKRSLETDGKIKKIFEIERDGRVIVHPELLIHYDDVKQSHTK